MALHRPMVLGSDSFLPSCGPLLPLYAEVVSPAVVLKRELLLEEMSSVHKHLPLTVDPLERGQATSGLTQHGIHRLGYWDGDSSSIRTLRVLGLYPLRRLAL